MSEKILIVDDDIDSLKLIGLMLQRQGYDVIAANAGGQALSKANAEHPDLTILDVMMPDMNGYEVCRRLRNNPDTQTIPIIMFTAKTLIDDKVAGFEAGADDYLTKPTHPAELASRVKSILARNTNRTVKEPSKGTTIGILGAKGGVGTTTVALNIGAAVANANSEKPIVADFRLGLGSMGIQMGFDRPSGMANVLSRPTSDIRTQLLEKELVTHACGLRGLLSSTRPKEAQLNFPLESALAVVQGLRTMGTPAVFDLGTGFTPLNSRLLPQMDRIILLVEPVPTTLKMGQELLKEFANSLKKRIDVVVVNRTQAKAQIPWHEVEETLGQEILAIISAAPELAFQATQAGQPIVIHQSTAIVSSQLIKLAEDVRAG